MDFMGIGLDELIMPYFVDLVNRVVTLITGTFPLTWRVIDVIILEKFIHSHYEI